MGNSLGPTLANAFFLPLRNCKWLENYCPSDFKPLFYRRYVDDTLILFRDPSHVAKFLDYLNSQHSCIKFTFDIEDNNQLNFLDVEITKTENSFQISVFHKSTFFGLGLQFDSSIHHHFRTNIISCLIDRAFNPYWLAIVPRGTTLYIFAFPNYPIVYRGVCSTDRKQNQNKKILHKQIYAIIPSFVRLAGNIWNN